MPRRGENIYQRKDGLWEARYPKGIGIDGKRKYGSVYAHSYREVKIKRQEKVKQIQECPQIATIQKLKLNDLISEWLFINRDRLKKSSYSKYCSIYENHLRDELGKCLVCNLSPVQIRQFVDIKQNEGLSNSTINGILVFIHTCLKYAHRQYGLQLIDIIYLKQSRTEMRVLSPKEQNRLVEYLLADMDIYKMGVLLALYTGIRVGELCAIKWADIEDGILRINKTMQRISKGKGQGTEIVIGEPKSATSNRMIPLPSFIVPIIEEFRRPDDYYLLYVDNAKEFTEPRVMQYRFNKYIKELGLPKANFHCLRHTFTTACIRRNFDVRSLSEVLGHSNVAITLNRYAHSSISVKTANMDKLTLFS